MILHIPIAIDLLIIRKNPEAIIHNEIGSFFKGHNIIEYKSPKDALNIDTLHKGLAYASLYKSQGSHVDEIRTDDITLTFIRQKRPEKLFRMLSSNGAVLEEESPGIYLIKGLGPTSFDTRIIATSELNSASHVWLSALTDNMSSSDAERLIISMQELSAKDDAEFANSVLEVAITKNVKTFNQFKEGHSEMNEVLREFIRDLFQPELDEKDAVIRQKDAMIEQRDAELKQRDAELEQRDAELEQKDAIISELQRRLAEISAV